MTVVGTLAALLVAHAHVGQALAVQTPATAQSAAAPVEPPGPQTPAEPPGPQTPVDPSSEDSATQKSASEVAAVQAELKRGVAQLRVEGTPAPYRAEARFVRAELLSLDGSYGGVITNVLDHQSAGTVEVRIGDADRDNSNFLGSESGLVRLDVPVETSAEYLRRKVWLALDRAFRGAARAYAQKQSVLERLAGDQQPADFTAPPASLTQPLAPKQAVGLAVLERDRLAKIVAQLSGGFAAMPSIDNGDVHIQVLRSHETVITSEGLALEQLHDRSVLAVIADTKAADGMHLDHGLAIHFQGVPPADEKLLQQGEVLVAQVLRELDELAQAPVIEEEYDGPILFRGPAAAQLLGATVATEAGGTPPPLADGGRMMDLEPAWQKRLGKNVMPPFIDLVDDPRTGFGAYSIDGQGNRPDVVRLVTKGVLKTLLMTRTPNSRLVGSNGRARITPALEVGPALSNLTLSSRRRGLGPAAMERELLRRAREDGYEFAFVVELLRDGSILGQVPRESAAAYAGTGKLNLPLPARVYKVEAGGKRTLVRGAVLAPASIRVLRRIRAVGRRTHVTPMRIPVGNFGGFGADIGMNGVLSQTVDVQIACPDLLVDGLELLVERGEHERLPTLEHPLRRAKPPIAAVGRTVERSVP